MEGKKKAACDTPRKLSWNRSEDAQSNFFDDFAARQRSTRHGSIFDCDLSGNKGFASGLQSTSPFGNVKGLFTQTNSSGLAPSEWESLGSRALLANQLKSEQEEEKLRHQLSLGDFEEDFI